MWLLAAGFGFLVVGALAIWLWYRSSADLDAIRSTARTANIPCTYEELALTPSPAQVLDHAKRLRANCPSIYSNNGKGHSLLGWPLFAPIPDALREHHRSLDPGKVAAWVTDLDSLPQQRMVFAQNQVEWQQGSMSHWVHLASLFTAQRAVLAESNELGQELTRLIHLSDRIDESHPMGLWARISVIDTLLAAVVARREELRQKPGDLPRHLIRLADDSAIRLNQSCQGAFVADLTNFADDPGGPISPDWPKWLSPAASAFAGRSGRAAYLRAVLQMTQLIKLHARSHERIMACRTFNDDLMKMSTTEAGPVLSEHRKYVFDHVLAVIRQELRLRLVAQELLGESWPDDCFAQPGTALERIERDGHLMGALSVGWNGRDDGGGSDDYYIGLYGPFVPTVVTSP